MPFFSIITPAYNVAKYISATIESVIEQTFTDWEMIVVDDESTDNTADIVEGFCKKDHRIRLIRQNNRKQAAARNTGIKDSKGEWICFLDGDDYWLPRKLATQFKFISSIIADIFYTAGYKLNDFNGIKEDFPTLYGEYLGVEMYKELYKANPVPILSVVVKASLISSIGYLDESAEIVGCEDLDLLIRLAYNNAIFYGIEAKLFVYRIHNGSISKNHYQMLLALVTVLIKNFDNANFKRQEVIKAFYNRFDPLIITLLERNELEKARELLVKFKKVHKGTYLKFNALFLKTFNRNSIFLIKMVNKINRAFEASFV